MYTLGDQIGKGGYATVYKCADEVGIRYVCKVLSKERNPRIKIQREIEMMKRMNFSVRVPKLIDTLENKESYYIIQEWCKGGSLVDYMMRRGLPTTENTVASVVRGVLRGLHHIHSADIIHGDIKPGNILLTDNEDDAVIKICDFGLAMECDSEMVEIDRLKGTPSFMAPENLRRDYCKKSDIWSLGIMTHLLLSNSLPFNSNDMQKLWYEILHKDPDFKNETWQSVSEPAKDFVRACLQKQPADRITLSECLKHPWLTSSDCSDRFKGEPLQLCEPFVFEAETIHTIQNKF